MQVKIDIYETVPRLVQAFPDVDPTIIWDAVYSSGHNMDPVCFAVAVAVNIVEYRNQRKTHDDAG